MMPHNFSSLRLRLSRPVFAIADHGGAIVTVVLVESYAVVVVVGMSAVRVTMVGLLL